MDPEHEGRPHDLGDGKPPLISRGRAKAAVVAAVSVLLVAGTSLAVKKLYTGERTGAARSSYDDFPRLAAYGNAGPNAPGGCPCCSNKNKGGESGVNNISKAALNYYASKYGDADITVEVKDFGCHQEAYVMKGEKLVIRLSIRDGIISEI